MTPRPFIKYILFSFLFNAVTLFPQSVASIEVSGNTVFSKNEYLSWLNISAGQKSYPAITDSMKSRTRRQLGSRGYFHPAVTVKIDSLDTSSVRLNLSVDENSPTYINNIVIVETDSAYIDLLNSKFELLHGEIFNKFLIEETISNILDYSENTGNPFAKIKILSIQFVTDSLSQETKADIYISLSKEQRSIIDKFIIRGNDKTKDYVIIRNSRIARGDYYSQDKIDRIPRLLNRLRFFEPVRQPVYYLNTSNEGLLEIDVVEKETNSFDGIIGYVPKVNNNIGGYFTGFVNIGLRNLFGTERAAHFRWQKEDLKSQELEIKYLEPWLLDYPFNIQAGMLQRQQDTTYVQRKFEGFLEFLATDEISASLIVSTESVIPTNPAQRGFTVFNSTTISTGGNLKFDSRDDVYAPREGFLMLNTYKYSSKKINGPAQFISANTQTDFTLQKFELDFNYYYELFNRQVIAAGVHGKELKSALIENSDLFKLGGTNSLRGYKERQFLGNRIFWSNLEYRYLITNRSFGFIFYDFGYYLRNGDKQKSISKVEETKYGYGLGISLESGIGVIAVSFALGQGDSFSQGKIHFGIMNEF